MDDLLQILSPALWAVLMAAHLVAVSRVRNFVDASSAGGATVSRSESTYWEIAVRLIKTPSPES